ncbi:DUF2971 domain-containing protein [Clostridium butyricum]|uniref:DUF2971 domain-containing protein n=1 Tax=Clostridium butyricum TaxID=1492 RepID=A0A0A6Q0B2_CLOBU|nr:DUF2971 domain-containing protein [Clostridium butyricum]KHD13420.1 hypothetical protein OA81_20900 [Clostridium butyricum]KHD16002.1 hypothetical protein OA81_06940 [Clostridium butyricum]PPV16544.1 hypothetical protein AWN73_09750 [Clostridium butyricum]
MLLYKFKSARSILDQYNELENQTIHFSSREDLNDPLEGYIRLYWQGDEIAWKGIFKNYINCLNESFFNYRIGMNKNELENINVFVVESTLLTESAKELSRSITNEFINDGRILKFIKSLGREDIKVDKEDLKIILYSIHNIALNIIVEKQYKYGYLNESDFLIFKENDVYRGDVGEILEGYIESKKIDNKEKGKQFFKIISDAFEEMRLHAATKIDMLDDERRADWFYITTEFTNIYLQKIENLIHSPCYLTCFSKKYNNSSMWGNYADNHKGICMIFNVNEKNSEYYLPLERLYSFSSNGSEKKVY